MFHWTAFSKRRNWKKYLSECWTVVEESSPSISQWSSAPWMLIKSEFPMAGTSSCYTFRYLLTQRLPKLWHLLCISAWTRFLPNPRLIWIMVPFVVSYQRTFRRIALPSGLSYFSLFPSWDSTFFHKFCEGRLTSFSFPGVFPPTP